MSFADDIADVLEELGEPVAISYGGTVEYDPITGAEIAGSGKVTLDGFGYPGRYESKDVDGTTVRATDVRLTLSRITQRPLVGWTATVDGKAYRIESTRPVRLSGGDVVYICQLRAS